MTRKRGARISRPYRWIATARRKRQPLPQSTLPFRNPGTSPASPFRWMAGLPQVESISGRSGSTIDTEFRLSDEQCAPRGISYCRAWAKRQSCQIRCGCPDAGRPGFPDGDSRRTHVEQTESECGPASVEQRHGTAQGRCPRFGNWSADPERNEYSRGNGKERIGPGGDTETEGRILQSVRDSWSKLTGDRPPLQYGSGRARAGRP